MFFIHHKVYYYHCNWHIVAKSRVHSTSYLVYIFEKVQNISNKIYENELSWRLQKQPLNFQLNVKRSVFKKKNQIYHRRDVAYLICAN